MLKEKGTKELSLSLSKMPTLQAQGVEIQMPSTHRSWARQYQTEMGRSLGSLASLISEFQIQRKTLSHK